MTTKDGLRGEIAIEKEQPEISENKAISYALNVYIPSQSITSDHTDDAQTGSNTTTTTVDYSQLYKWKTRNQVFYDEEITLYFQLNGLELGSLVDSITIPVEVKVIGLTPLSQNQSQNPSYTQQKERKHIIFSCIITKENLLNSTSDSAIWSINLPVIHPRSRLLQPKLVIDSAVKLGAASHEISPSLEDLDSKTDHPRLSITKSKYFDELVPIGQTNLFEALSFGSSDSYSMTVLDNDNVTQQTMTPVSSPHLDDDNDIQLASSELIIPVYPALNLRLRCAILSGSGDNESLIASIEITCGETAKVDVLITSVGLELTDGSVCRLGPIQLPQWLRPGENLVLCYSMEGVDGLSGGRSVPVTINIDCYPAVDGSGISANSKTITPLPSSPHVRTKWDTTVDFENSNNLQIPTAVQSPLANNTNSLDAVPIRRAGRPLNRTTSNLSINTSTASTNNPSSIRTIRPLLTNITLSFTGPSAVKVGEKFQWKVFAVNRSSIIRNLTLFFQSRETPVLNEKSIISNSTTITKNTQLFPVIDRAALRRISNARSLQNKGIVCLVNDVRIGPLLPQACFETSITLLALSPGIHTLGDSTLVDLSNGQGYDCGPLLEVVVSK